LGDSYPHIIVHHLLVNATDMLKKAYVRLLEGKAILALEEHGIPVIAEGAGEYSQVIAPVLAIQLDFHFGPIELTASAFRIPLPDKSFPELSNFQANMFTDKGITDRMPSGNNLLMDVYFFELLLDTTVVPFNLIFLQGLINNSDDILRQLAFRPVSAVVYRPGFEIPI
jgi:hypothetical protein